MLHYKPAVHREENTAVSSRFQQENHCQTGLNQMVKLWIVSHQLTTSFITLLINLTIVLPLNCLVYKMSENETNKNNNKPVSLFSDI